MREDREEQPRFGPAATDGGYGRDRGGDRDRDRDRGRDRDADRRPRGDFYRAGDRGDRDRDRGRGGDKTQVFVSNVSQA